MGSNRRRLAGRRYRRVSRCSRCSVRSSSARWISSWRRFAGCAGSQRFSSWKRRTSSPSMRPACAPPELIGSFSRRTTPIISGIHKQPFHRVQAGLPTNRGENVCGSPGEPSNARTLTAQDLNACIQPFGGTRDTRHRQRSIALAARLSPGLQFPSRRSPGWLTRPWLCRAQQMNIVGRVPPKSGSTIYLCPAQLNAFTKCAPGTRRCRRSISDSSRLVK